MNRIGRRILVTGLAFCLAAPLLPGAMMVRATEPATTTEAAPSEEEINAAKEKLMELLDKYSGEKIKQLVSDAIKKINQKDDITTTWLDDLIADTEEQAKIWGAQTAPTTPPSTDSSSGNSSGSSSSGSSDSDEDDYIDDDMREDAYVELINYKDSLIARENPEQYILDELDDIFYSANVYIANSETLTEEQLWAYVGTIKGQMDAAVEKSGSVTTTTEFLTLADNWQTPVVSYGQQVNIVLPLINLGEEWLTDLLVEPEVSNDVNEWPFKPDSTGYTQNFNEIPGCATKLYEEAVFNRRELTWTFTAREDVLTGYYPLKFKVWYSKDGIRCEEPAEVSVYVYCQGKPGSGRIGMSEQTNVSQPRIVVTGFETDPAEVYAGDTFMLNIHVKNTSPDTAVNNVLFDLEAVEGGTESSSGTVTNSYAAFLPTSGSSSIYIDRMPAGSTSDLKIEMQAKADLSQKPYVVTVKMKYDTDLKADLTDEAKVSIPVKQESKYDSSTPEINPSNIMVGEQSNVMFQIYNTGKTTLYNVQVKFEADSVEGGDTFIGNLQPGATGNVDAMVTGIAATMDDGTVKAVITYEDEAGNQTREEKDITIFVSDIPVDDGMMMDPMPMEEEKTGPGMGVVIAIALGIVVVAAAAVVAMLRIRKKKKDAKQLAEDLMDLDKDETL
ncbi:MAG TPA: hypothetical protein H9956_11205 [Candidatus Eisenbergiella pullicola]|nr:hypothetical protein [Candidatus Eisenbergiella pullicola]